ncbi:major facilitator superfamily domain-containing protein [Annulohypoxylon maeteangense]|uniref:major facilitator superfamily domain-containing protein n=1 Tax=Annulohypoxylon maeteangense TaxID=1927788 RepID=UPI002007272B|nr:major facilitator superfamily domain-containing protein [Annulohypoxylon maeteangense]KAI0889348.1 major facilitator superfamily domain-containing protein [Annulohypoxylon maeteangense]
MVEEKTDSERIVEISRGSKEGKTVWPCDENTAYVQLDMHGLALVPQPSNFRDDPLNWPIWLKWLVLLQVSFLAMLGPFNSSVVNPALVPLAALFKVPVGSAPLQTTTTIILAGVAPLFFAPLSNIYGRRPVYMLSTIVGIVATVGSGVATSWAGLIIGRVFSGIGTGAGMALGAATVNDMFFLHERGTKMGVWTVFLNNGAHAGPIIGGYLAQKAGVRWCYYLPAIVNSVAFVIMLFALPETLFSRSKENLARHKERTYPQMLFSFSRNALLDRRLHIRDLVRPFEMLKYPSISLTFIYYIVSFCFSSILPAVTVAILFTNIYHFQSGVIGLMLGLPLLIGSMLGEIMSGPFSDWVVHRYAERHGGKRKPEARLIASLGSMLLCPAGIIIYGVCLQRRTHWIGPVMGMAIASFGLQLVTTVSYTYCSDCYKPQSAEIGSLYNFGRQTFAFPIGFYALPFANRIGVQWAWITLALITALTSIGIIVLMFKGEQWRKRLGKPQFHTDI